MARKRKSPDRQPPHPSQKIMDVAPADFPKIGSTLSSYNPLLPQNGQPTGRKSSQIVAEADKKARRKQKIKKILKRSALTLLVLVLLTVGWVGWKFVSNAVKVFGGDIWGIFHSTKLKGEDTGHVNILLAGNSADDPGHGGADLTDSIMLISINTQKNTALLFSIPRDLWVNVPGYSPSKINNVYVDGQTGNFSQSGYPNGGMGLLEEVVDQDFGVNVDYYALINYAAIKDAVDAVGGININITSCDPRGLYDPNRDYATGGPLVDLSNGEHTLNGEQALDLARARGDPSPYGVAYGFCQSDFTREQYQREMLVALKDKAESAGVLSNPIALGNLFDSIGNNVQTDLSLGNVHRLYDITNKISGSAIQSNGPETSGANTLLQSYNVDGQDALAPTAGFNNYTAIQAYLQQLMQ